MCDGLWEGSFWDMRVAMWAFMVFIRVSIWGPIWGEGWAEEGGMGSGFEGGIVVVVNLIVLLELDCVLCCDMVLSRGDIGVDIIIIMDVDLVVWREISTSISIGLICLLLLGQAS